MVKALKQQKEVRKHSALLFPYNVFKFGKITKLTCRFFLIHKSVNLREKFYYYYYYCEILEDLVTFIQYALFRKNHIPTRQLVLLKVNCIVAKYARKTIYLTLKN